MSTNCFVQKWDKTGLLRGLEPIDAAKMAELLDRQASHIMGGSNAFADNDNDIASKEIFGFLKLSSGFLGNIIFPLIRRVFSQVKYDLIDSRVLPVDLDVSFTAEFVKDLNSYSNLDAEVEMCKMLADSIIERIGTSSLHVGEVPLDVYVKDGRYCFFTRSFFVLKSET